MIHAVAYIGARTLKFISELGHITVFGFRLCVAAVTPPLRGGLLLDEIYKLGVLSLMIICISGLTVGMVLGLQGYNTLVRFGAEESLGAVVALSLIREFGPVMTALLLTGRAGSATTAEIGTMVATEQLDGLRMMSVDPIDYVVKPKALMMLLVTPLLSALFIVFGIFGGYLIGVAMMGGDSGTFIASMENSVDFVNDVAGSFLKAGLFGVLIGLVATYRGYSCEPTSAGVSAATTSTVVTTSVSILIFDYFITALWGV